MKYLINTMVFLIAIEHIGFLVLEMFLWTGPIGQKVFRITADFAEQSAALAANQGLYNGFLAVGLAWALIHPNNEVARQLKYFFLGCVFVAGVYGWHTVSQRILFLQALPAFVTLGLVYLDGSTRQQL